MHTSFVIYFFLYMSFGKFSYCGDSHFSHRYCDTHIKYIFIGFDDILTEYPQKFQRKICGDIIDVAWRKKDANVITFHQLP